MSKRVDIPEKEQFLRTPCCKGAVYLKHYQIVRCDCGNYYWALQPNRGGDFVLDEWPGDCRTGPRQNGRPGIKKAA